MRRFLNEFLRKMSIWMCGRYGHDELNLFLSITAMLCLILSPLNNLLSFTALFLFIYTTFRIYSKNITKRRKELAVYLKIKASIKDYLQIKKDSFINRKTHKYYRCPKCRVSLRVPKGKGKIEIRCVKCGHKFIKKT